MQTMQSIRTISWIAVMAGSLLAASSGANAALLSVSADAHIDGTNATANFGLDTVLSIEQGVLGGNKAYLLFDASALGGTQVGRIENLNVVWAGGGTTRTLWFGLITGTGANDWTETSLTWQNAPGNNVTGTDRNFVAYAGQAVILLGTVGSAGGPSGKTLTLAFTEGSSEESALLSALNTGDRKATIGVRYNSSQTSSANIYSREYEVAGVPGAYAATLNYQLIPEPSTAALLCGGCALLIARRRR